MGAEVTGRDFPDEKQRAAVCYSQWRRSKRKRAANEQVESVTVHSRLPSTSRRENLNGRDHLVYPVVMLVEGVHNGRYYPADELSLFVEAWNGRPVPILHPTADDGEPISANSPPVYESQVVGQVWNARWDSPRLRAEIWIDLDKIKSVDPDTLSMLERGEPVEVSTGLWGLGDGTPGIWNGEEFEETLAGYRPDHLALLPDRVGACSWEDGCGVRVHHLNARVGPLRDGMITLELQSPDSDSRFLSVLPLENLSEILTQTGGGMAENNTGDPVSRDQKPTFLSWVRTKLGILASDDRSAEAITALQNGSIMSLFERVHQTLNAMDRPEQGIWYMLEDLYDDAIVYERRTEDGSTLYRQEYTVDDNGDIQLSGDPTRVREQREYVPAEEENSMPKVAVNETVKRILELNEKADQEWLEKQSPCDQKVILELLEAAAEGTPKPEKTPVQLAAEKGAEALQPKTPAPAAPVPVTTVDQYVANAPPEIREVLSHGLTVHRRQKDAIVTDLLALDGCPWGEDELRRMDLPQLEKLQTLARSRNDYSGGAGVLDARPQQDAEDPLPLPSLKQ